jgi:iron complex outermembrane receptor protein
MAYASWGKGVESQVVPNRPDLYVNSGQALPPVTSHQSEFGVKGQAHDLNWQLTFFSIVRPSTNLDACNRLYISPCTGAYDGTAKHSGLEASAQWRSGPWSLGGGVTLLHARREGSIVEPDTNGKRPTNVPDNVLRAQAQYRFTAVPGLALDASWSREGSRAVLPDASVTLPVWNQLDTTLRYDTVMRGTATTWTLGVDNLLDAHYYKESPFQFGHVYLFPGAPRQLRLCVQASL